MIDHFAALKDMKYDIYQIISSTARCFPFFAQLYALFNFPRFKYTIYIYLGGGEKQTKELGTGRHSAHLTPS